MSKVGDLYIEIEENAEDAFQVYHTTFEKPANPYADSTIGADKVWDEKFEECRTEFEDWMDREADRREAGW